MEQLTMFSTCIWTACVWQQKPSQVLYFYLISNTIDSILQKNLSKSVTSFTWQAFFIDCCCMSYLDKLTNYRTKLFLKANMRLFLFPAHFLTNFLPCRLSQLLAIHVQMTKKNYRWESNWSSDLHYLNIFNKLSCTNFHC